jgi:serine protease
VPVSIDGAEGSVRRFHIEVPPGATELLFVMNGGSGDADLYVKLGNPPTLNSWDARPYLNGNSESVSWNNPVPGTWYVMVHGYHAYAGVTLRALFAEAPPPPAGVTVLANGVPVTDLSGESGQMHFQITVPAGTLTLTFHMSGGSGDADLYVRFGAQPTLSTWDSRPFLFGNNETVSVTNPQSGLWYVMVHAYDPYAGVTLRVTYTP